jgi:hypothetical protein
MWYGRKDADYYRLWSAEEILTLLKEHDLVKEATENEGC